MQNSGGDREGMLGERMKGKGRRIEPQNASWSSSEAGYLQVDLLYVLDLVHIKQTAQQDTVYTAEYTGHVTGIAGVTITV